MKNERVEFLENSPLGICAPSNIDPHSHGGMLTSCPAGLDLSHSPAATPTGSAGSSKIETLLIEPNALLREGLKRILFETPYRPIASVAACHEISSIRLSESSIVILIMDAAHDPEEACRQIEKFRQDSPLARIVTLVETYNRERVLAAFQAGADACLMKSMSCEAFVKSLDLVVLGESILPASVLDLCYPGDPDKSGVEHRIGGLSPRETMILQCLMDGDSNKVIARKLDITEATVKVHMKTILRKTRLKNRTQAAMWASTQISAAKRPSTH